ncbi:MAG: trigger factor [Oligoflexus sp.]
MKALVEEVNTVQRRIKIELSESDVNTAFNKVYQNLRKKAHVRGFRPGKAPMQILKKFYGTSVAVDVADRLVRDHLFSAIEKESLQPIATPVLETSELPAENASYSFSALIDVMPSLKVEGYQGLELSYQPFVADDAALERELEMVQRRQGKTKDAEAGTAAAAGHIATISQTAKLEGEDFPPYSLEKVPLELGKQSILPEIEEGVIGLKVGEQRDIKVKIHETFPEQSLVGKEVDCVVTLGALQEMVLPELNDELAKDLGLENLDALKNNIRDGLARQAEQHKRNQLETDIFEQLGAKNQFDVPPSMVDQVIDSMIDDMQFPSDKERQDAKKDEEQRKALRETAKQRARNTLILSEIIKTEKIEVTDEDLDAYVADMISGAGKSQEELDQKLLESIKQSLGQQAKESLLFRKALDRIIEQANVVEKSE